MNLKQIIKKVVAGETPDAGEIEFLKSSNFEENDFLTEIDRLTAANAELSARLTTNEPKSQGKLAENELNSLRQQTKQLSQERDNAQKELKHWKYRQQIGELASQYQFSDVEYLAYLCEKNRIDLLEREAADGFMTELRSKAPKFFRADIQPGAKADLIAAGAVTPGNASIAELLSAAPEVVS